MSSSNPLDVTPNLSHAAVQDARLEEVAPSLRHHQNELLTHIRWEFESHTPWIPGHRQQWPLARTVILFCQQALSVSHVVVRIGQCSVPGRWAKCAGQSRHALGHFLLLKNLSNCHLCAGSQGDQQHACPPQMTGVLPPPQSAPCSAWCPVPSITKAQYDLGSCPRADVLESRAPVPAPCSPVPLVGGRAWVPLDRCPACSPFSEWASLPPQA